jgi:hypothetical protein
MTSAPLVADLPVSPGRLWFGVLAAPLAWGIAELLGYILIGRGCMTASGSAFAPGSLPVYVGLSIGCLLVALAGLVVAGTSARLLAGAHGGVAEEPAPLSRARFLARSAVVSSSLFLLGVAFMAILAPLLQPCSEVH